MTCLDQADLAFFLDFLSMTQCNLSGSIYKHSDTRDSLNKCFEKFLVEKINTPRHARPVRDVSSADEKIILRARLSFSATFCSFKINCNEHPILYSNHAGK